MSGLLPGHPSSLGPPPGRVRVKPMLTWSPTHSRSQVLWASTHRLGLSWLGHTPGWLPGPCGRLAPKVSPTRRRSGRSSLWADMGTTGPGGGGVRPPAPQAPTSPAPCRHPPVQACSQGPCEGWSSRLPFGPQGLGPEQMLVSTPVCKGLGGFRVCALARPLPSLAPLWSA